MQDEVWLQKGDIILVSLREYEDTADVIHKYYRGEAAHLVRVQETPADGTYYRPNFNSYCFISGCCS